MLAGAAALSIGVAGPAAFVDTPETATVPGTGCDLMDAEHAFHEENPDVWTRISNNPATLARFEGFATSTPDQRSAMQSQWGSDAGAVTRAVDTCAQW